MINIPAKEVFVTVSGKRAPVWIYGDTRKPPVFFIHGYPTPFSGFVGDLPVGHLLNDYCFYAFDLPGFGKTKHIMAESVSFIKDIVNQLIPTGKITLFGMSYGGVVALSFAYLYPERIEKIIVAGTPFFGSFQLLHSYLSKKRRVYKSVVINVISHFPFLTRKNLSCINAPVLLLYSQKDRLATVRMGKRLFSFLPNAKLVFIKDRPHSWLLHRIDENVFLPSIYSFLRGVSSLQNT